MSVKNQGAGDGSGINTEYDSPGGGGNSAPGTKLVDPPPKSERQQDQRKTMAKRIVTTSVGLLGLSIVLSHADKIINRVTTIPDGQLPAQSVYSIIPQDKIIDGTTMIPPGAELPAQSVVIDPKSFAVLTENYSFRTDPFNQTFNPTNSTPPIFQIFNPAFLEILGLNASIREIAHNDTFAFAHEAPIHVPDTDEVFFASNSGGSLGMSDLYNNNQVSKIGLGDVQGDGTVNVPITPIPLADSIQMTNGGTGLFKGNLTLATSGRGQLPPSIALVNPYPPYNVTIILDNYYGRQFNSLNDIKVHPSGKLFFTDVNYGFLNHFRPDPLMPNQVYRFDPDTGAVRVVATDFNKPNGIAFTGDGSIAYITDTAASGGFLGNNFTDPATIYAFDVDPKTYAFTNRRVLTYIDAGTPDGIQVDTQGNVYTGCADGVQVFAPDGTLLGKIFLGMSSSNMVFAPPDRLVILAETKVFLANITAKGVV